MIWFGLGSKLGMELLLLLFIRAHIPDSPDVCLPFW